MSLIDALEPRQLLTTPGDIQPETFATFDKGERQILISRMTHLPGQASLADKIGNGSSARLRDFDASLQDYTRSRTNVRYYFDAGDQQAIGQFASNELSTGRVTDRANTIVDDRKFPSSTNASDYAAEASGNINYRAPNGGRGNTFSQTMNRFEYWGNLADAVWVGGDKAKYTNEITYELARWSQQFDGNIEVPKDWSDTGKSGWTLITAIRAEAWTQAYFKLNSADNASFGGVDNTLLLYKLMQHGDWLYAQSQTTKADESVDSNKSISLAKSLYFLGRMFPEFDAAPAWEAKGRELLIESMNAQVYADGSHREQSPGYTAGVAEDVLDVYQLDKLNGDTAAWQGAPLATLDNMIESYRQLLDPDGRRPGIGDTYRTLSVSLFLKAGLITDKIDVTTTTSDQTRSATNTSINVADASRIRVGDVLTVEGNAELIRVTSVNGDTLGVQRAISGTAGEPIAIGETIYDLGNQPFAKPSIGDVWLLGVDRVRPFRNVPAAPEGVLGARGKAYAMPDGGNYVLRSGDSGKATQITFDAGPKGGSHGHNDLLNFELWSGGRPLIVDPGPYKYDGGSDRDYVVSTKAHNTVNVDGKNTGWVEGDHAPAITASYDFGANAATVQGTHSAYAYLDGQPQLSRAIWYDYGDTMLIVDFAESSTAHSYQQSFNLPGTADANLAGATGGSEFKTRYATGDNVRVKPVNGGTLVKGGKTFVTGDSSQGYKSDAYRYTITKDGQAFAVFVTLVNVYTGQAVPNVDAQLLTNNPQPGQPVQVRLTRDGNATQTLTFQQPPVERVAPDVSAHALVSDFKYDAEGNLHLAYQDLEQKYLRYTVKSATTGKWSPTITVDDAAHGVGAQIDLEIDNEDRPAIAYYDSANGDLKYAVISTQNDAWRTTTVDSRYTVGQNPSLTFSRRGNSALISYYNRTKGDLKVAEQQSQSSWSVRTFDSAGNVGRYSQISLDPNRPELNSRYAIAYEDRDHNGFKYAYVSGDWKIDDIRPKGITAVGDRLSLAWEDTGSGTVGTPTSNRFQPRFSFYEYRPDASLWFASRDKSSGDWSTARIDGGGTKKFVGGYSQLSYASGKAEVFYFDSRNDELRRGILDGRDWTFASLGAGGREGHIARHDGKWTILDFDDETELLKQHIV